MILFHCLLPSYKSISYAERVVNAAICKSHNTPEHHPRTSSLLERNETRRVGGTDTRSSVLDWVAIKMLADVLHMIIKQCDRGREKHTKR